jgi:hypothetical protein
MIRVTGLSLVLLLAAVGCGTQTPVKCTTANCSGCCTDTGDCLGPMKQSQQACGTARAECRVCLPDQLCSAGKCLHDPNSVVVLDDAGNVVDAGSGDSGVVCGGSGQACCGGTTCFLTLSCMRGFCGATAPDAGPCGGLGQMCCSNQQCTASGTTCANNTCVTASSNDAGTTMDAGVLRQLGEACALDRECADGVCLVNGFQGGYCTKACTTMGDCTFGSTCGGNPSQVGPTKICFKQCTMANQAPGGCRANYICEPHAGTAGLAICFPACQSLTSCANNAPTCDSRGFCCGAPGLACCEGSTCSMGTCMSGSCVAGGTGGGSGGTGGGSGGTGGGSGTTGGGSGSTGGGSGSGTNLPTGSACTSFLQCAGNACITQNGTQWTGGYCSNLCTSSCATGSSCSPYAVSGNSYCLADCTWDGGAGGCRAGYVCDRNLIPGSSRAACLTSCTGGACPSGTTCDNGFCCGQNGFKCCSSGTACAAPSTCGSNGYCQ